MYGYCYEEINVVYSLRLILTALFKGLSYLTFSFADFIAIKLDCL